MVVTVTLKINIDYDFLSSKSSNYPYKQSRNEQQKGKRESVYVGIRFLSSLFLSLLIHLYIIPCPPRHFPSVLCRESIECRGQICLS